MSDQPRKHFVGAHGRRLSREEALELGRRLFDLIEGDRLGRTLDQDTTTDDDQEKRDEGQ
jgi:hypothetical protein